MTEEIINADGSRNWEANILLDNVKRLEQENEKLKEENVKLLFGKGALIKLCDNLTKIIDEKKEKESKLWQALEEIRENLVKLKTNDEDDFTYEYSKIEDKINEVLDE